MTVRCIVGPILLVGPIGCARVMVDLVIIVDLFSSMTIIYSLSEDASSLFKVR